MPTVPAEMDAAMSSGQETDDNEGKRMETESGMSDSNVGDTHQETPDVHMHNSAGEEDSEFTYV